MCSQTQSESSYLQEMEFFVPVFSLFLSLVSCASSDPITEPLRLCMTTQLSYNTEASTIIHTSNSSSYSSILISSEQNPRWLNSTSKPLLILTPFNESEIRAAVLCSRKCGIQIRVRSGGHDYEGLSYLCKTPFIIIDMINFKSIDVNIADETAWVQSGATLGELYYSIGKKSDVHGFPAGICPTVGIGGHFSGGGFGTLVRKHGLAADHVIDAVLIDANGKIMNRETMGEDLFWAIRGGGGASFGIIVSWKIKLVQVPKVVTGFTVSKLISQDGGSLVNRWQYIADRFHEDLFMRVILQNVGSGGQKQVQADFNSLYLGGIDTLMPLMKQSFPELGLEEKDCIEMSWVQSAQYFAGYKKEQPLEVLLSREALYKSNFKGKSDFVTNPIPEIGLQGIWERFMQEQLVFMILDPYGGKMAEISEFEIPFPHRKGNIYNIQYIVKWDVNEASEAGKHMYWMDMLYRYMKPYVSNSPRGAYINYKDLELGTNNRGTNTSYMEASSWGRKYFKNNFKRLAVVKSRVDPHNFFRNEQSIPPFRVLSGS
ncbi:LOW QUALITY PROTEIN: berberine bridge enzyme-like 22 [Argentina anserina]|uniref:LOW QUALITY PROTEIN: berberine bridge enzyme-like 22 n=1 Tax=Argentina anserina TaxID=57926 RepID=UPI0021762612|nr:LOW QUALITY PROTEIN: berberine bridge enzyme-like 22 [Potentilla anserina]